MTTQQAPPDDAALLLRARSGDAAAIEALYGAYFEAGRRFAISLAGADAADDLTADVWTKVLGLLQSGRGPNDNFRAYLFTSIRNRFYDKMRVAGRERPASDEPWLLDDITPPSDEIADEYDDDTAVAALQTLPARWQTMLWQLEVQGHSVPEVAEFHDIDTAAVSSAAYRAREGLRAAYLDQQINGHLQVEDRECAWVRKRMSRFVRASASARASERIEAHALVCAECEEILVGLQATNRKFGLLLLPILLVGTGGTKVAALWGGAAGLTGTVSLLWGRMWDWVRTPGGSVVTAATILALAGPGAIWATQDPAPPPDTGAAEAPASPPASDPPAQPTPAPPAPKPGDEPAEEDVEAPADQSAPAAPTVQQVAATTQQAAPRTTRQRNQQDDPAPRARAVKPAKPPEPPINRGDGKKVGHQQAVGAHPGKGRSQRALARARGRG